MRTIESVQQILRIKITWQFYLKVAISGFKCIINEVFMSHSSTSDTARWKLDHLYDIACILIQLSIKK